jgi:hypothetical protein
MGNIQSMATLKQTIDEALTAPIALLGLIFEPPNLRPPVLDEMLPDLERLISKVASQNSDSSCPELMFEELVAEGRAKLSYILNQDRIDRKAPTRESFFKFFATALNNHVRSLVHKYRFTEKRTGVKPPPRGERFTGEARMKTAEVRMDDEEVNLQVASQSYSDDAVQEVMEDYDQFLGVDEQRVMREMASPSKTALTLAWMDAHLGTRPGDPIKIKIKAEHLAAGVEMDTEKFNNVVLSLRTKIKNFRSMTSKEEQNRIRRSACIAHLERVFNVQVPPNMDDIIVRRLFTIAARDQFDKIKDDAQTIAMLDEIGAKVPRVQGDVLNCFGVLYQKNHRICNACDLRNACAVEASNVGLGKIAPSPRLLGAKQTRVPAILPGGVDTEDVAIRTAEEEEIMHYLEENFAKTTNKNQVFYIHKEKFGNATKHLFHVSTNDNDLKIRFCKPSETLKKKLRYESKCWFIPPGLPVAEIISLIDAHAKETYDVAGV